MRFEISVDGLEKLEQSRVEFAKMWSKRFEKSLVRRVERMVADEIERTSRRTTRRNRRLFEEAEAAFEAADRSTRVERRPPVGPDSVDSVALSLRYFRPKPV